MVLTAHNISRKINYAKAIGNGSLKPVDKSMQIDNKFWLASVSKQITAIAALQSVDGGHFTLDEDATRTLPEFKGIRVLTSFDERTGEPILVPVRKKITLR